MASNFVEQKSLVPIIPKNKFDDIATEFLNRYYPEALKKPMPIPIIDIAKKKMGLRIVPDFHLSEDFSVYGQMCFTSGKVPVYIKEDDAFVDIKVKRGTMLIDPDTLFERNIGCLNNTVAHECVHLKNCIWKYIGYKPEANNDEVDAYLVEYLFDQVSKVVAKHNLETQC